MTPFPLLQDVDIKKQAGNNPYAFIQFVELSSAIQARRRMDREFVGRNRVKVQDWILVLSDLRQLHLQCPQKRLRALVNHSFVIVCNLTKNIIADCYMSTQEYNKFNIRIKGVIWNICTKQE